MLETFMAGFLGIVSGAVLVSFLFYLGYSKERQFAQESADKLFKLLGQDTKPTKNASILSLIKNTDKDTPVN